MKRFFRRAAAVALIVMLFSAPYARAELKRGDRGDDVFDLQQLLFETGWLFELPDGIFGKNTETAVRGFEKYAGLSVDGIADDRMIYELAVSLEKLNGEVGIVSDYFGEHVSEYFIASSDAASVEWNDEGTTTYTDGYTRWTYTDDSRQTDISSDSQEAIVLNSSVIIDGQMVYYAGNIEGEGNGVYAMYADGSDRIKLCDIQACLLAASNGHLLVWHYDDNGYAALEVLRSDGRLSKVGYGNAHAIAKNGRFYFGGSSVAEDGSDHQWLLSSDPEYHDNYYPLDVVDGYLYYLDANGASVAYTEGDLFPKGDVKLNRLNLESGKIDYLSGAGTRYLGIEDGMLYYMCEDLEIYDYESGNTIVIDADDGLYAMNLEVLAATKIAELSDNPLIFEHYMFVEDGVVYGEYSDYNSDEAIYKVLRRKVNGEELPALELSADKLSLIDVADGVLCGILSEILAYDDIYAYNECIVVYDLRSEAPVRLPMEENEALSYTELRPQMAIIDGRIYYYVQDTANGAEILKSAALNGHDIITLSKSAPLY